MNKDIERIVELIFILRRSLHEQCEFKDKGNVSLLQLLTLKYVREKKPRMLDIAKHLGIAPPSATSLMENLANSGLVVRKQDESDRRIVRMVLTDKGEKYLRSHKQEIIQTIGGKLKNLNAQEQKQLVQILKKISN